MPPAAASEPRPEPADCRCLCGSLLARVVDGRLELKCRRCKRTLSLPLPAGGEARPVRAAPLGDPG